jgi:hypothetical protein
MKEKRFLNQDLLNLLIITTVTVFIWIGFDVYRALHQASKISVPKDKLTPLEQNFNKDVLESLKKRKYIDKKDLEAVPEASGTAYSVKTASPTSSPSSAISPSPEASQSGKTVTKES